MFSRLNRRWEWNHTVIVELTISAIKTFSQLRHMCNLCTLMSYDSFEVVRTRCGRPFHPSQTLIYKLHDHVSYVQYMLISKRKNWGNPKIKPKYRKDQLWELHTYKTRSSRLGSASVVRATMRNRLRDMFSPTHRLIFNLHLSFQRANYIQRHSQIKVRSFRPGGEGFTSPRSWLKAILGSRRKVKNELAWKMVIYYVTINAVDTWFSFLKHAPGTIAFHF